MEYENRKEGLSLGTSSNEGLKKRLMRRSIRELLAIGAICVGVGALIAEQAKAAPVNRGRATVVASHGPASSKNLERPRKLPGRGTKVFVPTFESTEARLNTAWADHVLNERLNSEKQIEVYDSPSGKITIIGNGNFIQQSRAALDLLQNKTPNHFKLVVDNMGMILQVDRGSGMNPWFDPTIFFATDEQFRPGTSWYAGVLVHDANHSIQWKDYKKAHPNQPVPPDIYSGETAERECTKIQLAALEQIGAPQDQIDWAKAALETRYWEIPHEKRDW
ncbi:hypothetical protein HYW35_02495 [Candidatus Saccharibacteria bacterium]|nr:hypothetical protein [Candidatus Saccharibacteria bacterium]